VVSKRSSERSREQTHARQAMSRRVLLGGIAGSAVAAILAACGSTSATNTPVSQPTTAPTTVGATSVTTARSSAISPGIQNKTLRLRVFENLLNMDPAFIGTVTDSAVSELIYSKLLRYNVNTKTVEPDLAESWELSPDAKIYTFKLRKGVRWQRDYGEFTSADVKYSWERIMDKKNAAQYYADFQPVESVANPDPSTVVVTMKQPYPAFVANVVTYTPGKIANQRAIEELKEKYVTAPVGTGPYEFVKSTAGASVDLRAFGGYFGKPQTVSDVRFVITADDQVAELAVEKGDIDVAILYGQTQQKQVVENKALGHDTILGGGIVMLEINAEKPPLNDLKVRQALQYATDKASIVKFVLLDQAQPAATILNPGMFGYDGAEMYPYNPEKAKGLLAEAGYPSGLPNPLRILVGTEQSYVDVATAVQQQWSKIGVKTEIQSVERALRLQRVKAHDFDLQLQPIARTETSQYLIPYTSSAGVPYPNAMNYTNADEFTLKAVVEPDEAKRKALYGQAQQRIKQDSPLIPLYNPNYVIAIRPEIEGAKLVPTLVYNVQDIRFKV